MKTKIEICAQKIVYEQHEIDNEYLNAIISVSSISWNLHIKWI